VSCDCARTHVRKQARESARLRCIGTDPRVR
jgi:hypothetical protein